MALIPAHRETKKDRRTVSSKPIWALHQDSVDREREWGGTYLKVDEAQMGRRKVISLKRRLGEGNRE